ncbi:hypothetical protein [Mucilaginibacter sp.]|uniref:hypothetical protein n=1 Tax=Mucilaginibacter sp. TaxID=1882438 RepID=UPI0025DA372C|nr:hypothetical protein [Mucilaginibacter sp.]
MITAEATLYPTYLHVVYKYPDSKPKEVDFPGTNQVILIGRAKKAMYAELRLYIIKVLTGWLHQRMYVFEMIHNAAALKQAAGLVVLIGVYDKHGYWQLCDRVNSNRAVFEALAPAEKSEHYVIYQNRVLPVLEHCQRISEGQE